MKIFHSQTLSYLITIIFVSANIFFTGCSEIGPGIDLKRTSVIDTTYISPIVEPPQPKAVLLEDFTGVRCLNCPKGHQAIENLQAAYPGKIVAVGLHSNFLAQPYPFGTQDLRTEEAQALEDFLGPAPAKPSAAIDRKVFSGETSRLYLLQKWASYVAQQTTLTTPVNIHLNSQYNNATRELLVTVELHYTSEVQQGNRLSLMITEDNIVEPQLNEAVIDTFYVHQHVLRTTLTPFNGEIINVDKQPGRVVRKSFKVDALPPSWVAANCKIIALVHLDAGAYEVLHAAVIPIQ